MTVSRRPVDLLFVGLAKNCARALPGFLSLVDQTGAAGLVAAALIGENGSTDTTRTLLETAADGGGIVVVDTAFLASVRNRLERMARGREHLRLRAVEMFSPRFVCVLDLDEVMRFPPPVAQIVAALQRLESDTRIFAASAVSLPHYYDILAFRDGAMRFDDLEAVVQHAKANPFRYYGVVRDRIFLPQASIDVASERLVESAFNGLALYRWREYASTSYIGPRTGSECEHATLNSAIAKQTGQRMLITPLLSLRTPPEHRQRGFAAFWLYRVAKLTRGTGSALKALLGGSRRSASQRPSPGR